MVEAQDGAKKRVARVLRAARRRLGISVSDVAFKAAELGANLDEATIRAYEKTEMEPELEHLEVFAEIYGIPVGAMFAGVLLPLPGTPKFLKSIEKDFRLYKVNATKEAAKVVAENHGKPLVDAMYELLGSAYVDHNGFKKHLNVDGDELVLTIRFRP